MKDRLGLFLGEILYFLILNLFSFLMVCLQAVGKVCVGTSSSFIFTSKVYEYNTAAYIAGAALFVIGAVVLFELMLTKRMEVFANSGVGTKLLWVSIALFFSVCMLISIGFGLFCSIGLNSNMNRNELSGITWIGWPLLCFIYSIAMMVSRAKKTGRDEAKSVAGN